MCQHISATVEDIPQSTCQNGDLTLTSQNTAITSSSLRTACGGRLSYNLVASPGQTMNISFWNFKPSSASLGTLTDKLSGNAVELIGESRHQILTSSVGSQMTLTLGRWQDDKFMFEVSGKFVSRSLRAE